MNLLGPYNTTLQAFHYAELLDLYKSAIALGDFAGDQTFDEASIQSLIAQSQDFATLPMASAGQRVTDDSLNNPLDLLVARYAALVSEAAAFDAQAEGLISVLVKDTGLLDQLLASTDLQNWIAQQPKLIPGTQFSWDYGMGNGPASDQVPTVDPDNDVDYPTNCPTNTYLDVVDASEFTGLVAPEGQIQITAKNLIWTWLKMTPGEQSEDLYGTDWAELNLLEDNPLINFLPNPAVQTQLPSGGSVTGVFSIAGSVAGGSLPIFIQTLFTPRRNQVVLTPQNAIPDGGFEAGGSSWTLGPGWTIQSGAGAHSGSKYASKSPLPVWSSATAYNIGDVVAYETGEWIAIAASTAAVPNDIGSTFWKAVVGLLSQSFPLDTLDQVYVEAWIQNKAADGIVNVGLSCRDITDTQLSPLVLLPGVSSAEDYLKISEVLQAIDNPAVATGRIIVFLTGHTAGTWSLDDFRVHLPQNLSSYVVGQDDVAVYIPKPGTNDEPLTVYFDAQDFVVDDISNVTFMDLVDGQPYTVRFTENFPAYQCSVNEKVWSPLVMLDPNRPYPDTETAFDPIDITVDSEGNRTLFPITDELGVPTGLTLQVISRPLYEYYIQVTTPATPQYGATAILEIDLSNPTYMDALALTPFSGYPLRLTKVEIESFTADTRQTIGAPNVVVDRPVVLTFPTSLIRKVYLTLYQENYNLSEYVVQPPDAIRRDTLFALQSVLPFNVRRPSRAVPVYYRGAQYTFGIEAILGLNSTPVLPGIFIAGPQHFTGVADVIRFDAQVFDEANFEAYLCYKAYDASGVLIDSNLAGIPITIGSCIAFPYSSPSIVNMGQVKSVDIFMKFIFRSADAVLERYLLQVSKA